MQGKGLGFRPGKVDERDWPLGATLAQITRPETSGRRFYYNPERLDQGRQGACVGYGWMQSVNSSPKTHHYTNGYATTLYKLAQTLDDWPGENYEGTSVRAGAKAAIEKQYIQAYAFTYDIEEVAAWILSKGPVVVGVDWYEGMDDPNKDNDFFIEPTGSIRGGHCTLLDGVRFLGGEDDYFRVLNSWGADFGEGGRCKIRPHDLEALLKADGGVAATSVEV